MRVTTFLPSIFLAMAAYAAPANVNPAVSPVNASALGATYGEWSAKFWQWNFSMPVEHHPLFETADCSAGQTGNLWFLGGTAASFEQIDQGNGVILGTATRTCTVPPGTWLFIPLVNAECSTLPGDHPGFGTTEADLRACATYFTNFVNLSTMTASLDGVPITALNQYRAGSPLFSIGPLPANNIAGAPAGSTATAVSDGYYLMLHPLSVGQHILKFHAELDLRSIGGSDFVQDITYIITVGH